MAEMVIGQPLFPGDSSVDQLVEIIKILGTPTAEQIQTMNRSYTEFKFPQLEPTPWTKLFRNRATPAAIDLITKVLQYTPSKRISALEALAHEFFDELRQADSVLPNNQPLPELFNFTQEGLAVLLTYSKVPY